MKKIIVVKDPECEVGFAVLTEYCAQIQQILGKDVLVLPIWPSGSVEAVDTGDRETLSLIAANLNELLAEYNIEPRHTEPEES